ncbi:Fic family protein [Paenibacillus faecis]|uniref:Fic family protein n=1 Tax=Paenibacillus faecis TaxID=862114 RepID=A0A5D0CZ64_9BACL|nr:Fic family protein [Paenibacillus faecis]TYA15256.1 Fic family protein [Paenibacillus faecis]
MDFGTIDQLKSELDALRPLPAAAVKNLEEIDRVEWTYHSNAMEGNTLTLLETKLVLEDGLTIGGKKLSEHFEVVNHSEAIDYVQDIVDRKIELTEFVIKSLHHLVLKNIDDELSEKMEQLLQWYDVQKDKLHPVRLAAEFHFRFVYIHSFNEGNGRTARLLMNLILMKYGYPPAIVKAETMDRLRYYETLEAASVQSELEPFVELIAGCVEESLRRYIGTVK